MWQYCDIKYSMNHCQTCISKTDSKLAPITYIIKVLFTIADYNYFNDYTCNGAGCDLLLNKMFKSLLISPLFFLIIFLMTKTHSITMSILFYNYFCDSQTISYFSGSRSAAAASRTSHCIHVPGPVASGLCQ